MFRPFALAVAVASLATVVSAQDSQPTSGTVTNPAAPAVQNPVQLFPPQAATAPAGTVAGVTTGAATAGATAFGVFTLPAIVGAVFVGAIAIANSTSDTQ